MGKELLVISLFSFSLLLLGNKSLYMLNKMVCLCSGIAVASRYFRAFVN